MIKYIYLALLSLLVSLAALTACQAAKSPGTEVKVDGGSYRLVTVSELQTMLKNKDFVLINVHIPWQGDISQTDQRLPYDEIGQNLDLLPADKDAKILVYCLTSGMAKKAIATLLTQGYTNLWMLDGGTTSWQEAGLTLKK